MNPEQWRDYREDQAAWDRRNKEAADPEAGDRGEAAWCDPPSHDRDAYGAQERPTYLDVALASRNDHTPNCSLGAQTASLLGRRCIRLGPGDHPWRRGSHGRWVV